VFRAVDFSAKSKH